MPAITDLDSNQIAAGELDAAASSVPGPAAAAGRDAQRPAGFILPRRARITVIGTWPGRAAPYLARIIAPGIASAALIALGTDAVLDVGLAPSALVTAAATGLGTAACVLDAIGRIRQYRTHLPPTPYL
ncbi:hypothetical protein [Glycomyces sp. NPDC047010]|uniref:hypothetical protein n=1 Tax=Glycomyces sp. NPDC047010 TaxID=3155023 RepID=UPI0033D2609A